MDGIEKLAKTKAEQLLRKKERGIEMSDPKKVDPYEEEHAERKRREVREYMLDECDPDNEKYNNGKY